MSADYSHTKRFLMSWEIILWMNMYTWSQSSFDSGDFVSKNKIRFTKFCDRLGRQRQLCNRYRVSTVKF